MLRPYSFASRLAAWLAFALLAGVATGGGRPATLSAGATIVYVDRSAGGSFDGTSWENAYSNLTHALSGAPPLSEVWVAEGLYTTGFSNTDTFALVDNLAIYGGFAGNETARGQRNPSANVTVLSGTAVAYHVVSAIGVDSTAVLDGFTITGGSANGADDDSRGAGILSKNSNANFANLVLTGNRSNVDGGAIHHEAGSATFSNIRVTGNTAGEGGGMSVTSGSPSISNATFSANIAGGGGAFFNDVLGTPSITNTRFVGNNATSGGAFYNNGGTPSLSGVLFSRNGAVHEGGAAYWEAGNGTFRNVTFDRNRAATEGGALFVIGGQPSLSFVTMSSNRAATGGGIFNHGGNTSVVPVNRSILWGNTPEQVADSTAGAEVDIDDSTVQGGCPANVTCAGISTADPKLGPLANNGGPSATRALLVGSPAIDVAPSCTGVTTDQRGIARPVDGNKDGTAKCDLGAYEAVPGLPSVLFTLSSSTGNESATAVNLAVKLSTTAVTAVTVKFAVTGGTATGGGKDYTLASGTLTFPVFTTTKDLVFTVVNDVLDEPNERVTVTLSAPTGAVLGAPSSHTYTIKDDDPTYRCHGRVATIVGTAVKDTLAGTKGPDVIAGLAGNDTISGNGGDDIVCAGPGNDAIAGGNGHDMLFGEGGNDTLRGDIGVDVLFGAAGNDCLAGGATPGDSCNGGPGADALLSNASCEATSSVP